MERRFVLNVDGVKQKEKLKLMKKVFSTIIISQVIVTIFIYP